MLGGVFSAPECGESDSVHYKNALWYRVVPVSGVVAAGFAPGDGFGATAFGQDAAPLGRLGAATRRSVRLGGVALQLFASHQLDRAVDDGFALLQHLRWQCNHVARERVDHKRLIYRHEGRDYRLTDVSGNVVNDLIG